MARNLYYHDCSEMECRVIREFADKKKEPCNFCGKKKWKRYKV